MSRDIAAAAEVEVLRPLYKHEIDRMVETALLEVTAPDPAQAPRRSFVPLRPRWIGTAEFVERMRRYVVYN